MASAVSITVKTLKSGGSGLSSACVGVRGSVGPLLPDSLAEIAIDVAAAATSGGSGIPTRCRVRAMSSMSPQRSIRDRSYVPISSIAAVTDCTIENRNQRSRLGVASLPQYHRYSSSSSGSGAITVPIGAVHLQSVRRFSSLLQELDESLIITASCARRIKQLQQQSGNPLLHLRVAVEGGGCSGFQYSFEMEDSEPEEDDKVFDKDNCRVVVDSSSFEMIKGSTVDFTQEMIRRAFSIKNNPQSESACGCGSSFAVKNFSSNPALD